jgi:hypothetical protein
VPARSHRAPLTRSTRSARDREIAASARASNFCLRASSVLLKRPGPDTPTSPVDVSQSCLDIGDERKTHRRARLGQSGGVRDSTDLSR